MRIKSLFFLLLLLIIPTFCSGGMIIQKFSSDAGSDCPGGDEIFYWDGDHSTSSVTACDSSGSGETGSQTGGTISSSYGQSGNGFRKTAQGQYIEWSVTSDDLIDDAAGTVWMSVYVTDDAARTDTNIFESHVDNDNGMWCFVRSSDVVRFRYESNTTVLTVTTTDTITTGSWTRIGFSWNYATTALAVKVGTGSWVTGSGTMTAWTPDDVTIGENLRGGSETDTIDIDNVTIFDSYQKADPGT